MRKVVENPAQNPHICGSRSRRGMRVHRPANRGACEPSGPRTERAAGRLGRWSPGGRWTRIGPLTRASAVRSLRFHFSAGPNFHSPMRPLPPQGSAPWAFLSLFVGKYRFIQNVHSRGTSFLRVAVVVARASWRGANSGRLAMWKIHVSAPQPFLG